MFAAGDARARKLASGPGATSGAVSTKTEPLTAPKSRLLIALHMVAFAVMYFGIERAVFHSDRASATTSQRVLGTLVILAGAALTHMARVSFASWRFRAKIDVGHQLATEGPFQFIRHPIYAGLDLLAIGTGIWIPSPIVLTSAVLMVLGGDLRARAEEPLLERAFGETYRYYRNRTWRFIPRLY